MAGRIANLAATLYACIDLSEESYAKVREALDKAQEFGIEEGESIMEEKACEWLRERFNYYAVEQQVNLINDFRKAMED